MQEVKNVLRILKETHEAIMDEDPRPLKGLSDQTLHVVSTTGDEDNIAVAVMIYSIGKTFERYNFHTLRGWSSFKRITLSALKASIQDLEAGNIPKFRNDFSLIKKAINKISGKLKKYIEDVFKKAEIVKASRIHEHGLSLEKTAKLLGISLYDLKTYTGQTGISDVPLNKTINVQTRIKFVETIFK